MDMPLDIEHYVLNELWVIDEDYAEWLETMHVDPFEILDDFPALIEGEVENE